MKVLLANVGLAKQGVFCAIEESIIPMRCLAGLAISCPINLAAPGRLRVGLSKRGAIKLIQVVRLSLKLRRNGSSVVEGYQHRPKLWHGVLTDNTRPSCCASASSSSLNSAILWSAQAQANWLRPDLLQTATAAGVCRPINVHRRHSLRWL